MAVKVCEPVAIPLVLSVRVPLPTEIELVDAAVTRPFESMVKTGIAVAPP